MNLCTPDRHRRLKLTGAVVAAATLTLLMQANAGLAGTSEQAASKGQSCGTVTDRYRPQQSYHLKIIKGHPSCKEVRKLAKRYSHPDEVRKPCPARACWVSIYPDHWKCSGFFQGFFGCWHGGRDVEHADEVFQGELAY